eukprot:TRINITY_DN11951_c0_g1_i2.p1 TRINITY_DN11951_c0_g1~~TRINITY_DN11951_c0_g1_i2.p1  ORF type:complete len:809 (+),score=134.74 TRINITY_DN11951_c0_g1_i2:116-2542(+)
MARPDILQFTCPVYYAKEGEESFSVDVMRLGSMKGRISCRLFTEDGSAKAGEGYLAVDQQVIFEDGQNNQTVCIPITEDDRWAPTLEFKIKLESPRSCTLGVYLKTCRVKLYTDDTFPSNTYKDALKLGGDAIDEISGLKLFYEFFIFNLYCPGMLWRTMLTIILDQCANLYLFFTLNAKAYLVNKVLSKDVPPDELLIPDKKLCAVTIGVLFVLPRLIMHFWSYKKLTIDIEGRTKAMLQAFLFRKYLNYNNDSRESVTAAEIQLAVTKKCGDLAAAYTAVLEMVQQTGRLVLLVVFTLTHDPSSWWVIVVMPTLMIIFGYCRSEALSKAGEQAGPLNRLCIALINETCEKYNLIAEYAQRPQMNELFESRVQQLRESVIPEAQVESNNCFFPDILGPLFVGLYIALFAESVLEDTIPIGNFLAMISVFGDVSDDFSSIYQRTMTINTRLDSMVDLTKLLNKKTDVPEWKALNRHRRELTKEYRAAAMKLPEPAPDEGLLRTDLMPIEFSGVSFGYGGGKFIFRDVTLLVPQGKMIALVGQHGMGKGTFLKLLGHRIFPSHGTIFVPTHLRILYVSQMPTLLDLSPWKNLVFGAPDLREDDDDHRDRVRKILDALEMQKVKELLEKTNDSQNRHKAYHSGKISVNARVVSRVSREEERPLFDSDGESECDVLLQCCSQDEKNADVQGNPDLSWMKTLTYTDTVKISLARAILMNPEVLVLHRPFHHYDNDTGDRALKQLKEHHKNRGLGMPEEERLCRRPRSVFYSPETEGQAEKADVVWQIGRKAEEQAGTVFEISKYKINKDFSA